MFSSYSFSSSSSLWISSLSILSFLVEDGGGGDSRRILLDLERVTLSGRRSNGWGVLLDCDTLLDVDTLLEDTLLDLDTLVEDTILEDTLVGSSSSGPGPGDVSRTTGSGTGGGTSFVALTTLDLLVALLKVQSYKLRFWYNNIYFLEAVTVGFKSESSSSSFSRRFVLPDIFLFVIWNSLNRVVIIWNGVVVMYVNRQLKNNPK